MSNVVVIPSWGMITMITQQVEPPWGRDAVPRRQQATDPGDSIIPSTWLASIWPFSFHLMSQSHWNIWSVAHLMQVLESEDDLCRVDPHFALLELLSLVKVGEQLPATHIIWKVISSRRTSSMSSFLSSSFISSWTYCNDCTHRGLDEVWLAFERRNAWWPGTGIAGLSRAPSTTC